MATWRLNHLRITTHAKLEDGIRWTKTVTCNYF